MNHGICMARDGNSATIRCRLVFPLLLSLVSVALFPLTHAATEEARGNFLALCVGLKYPGTGNSLRFSTNDVREIAAAFRKSSGYDESQHRVEVLVDDDPSGSKPTGAEIRDRLARLAAMAEENDRLVFYFSGHGILDQSERSVLVCGEGRSLQDPSEHLALSEVKDILARSRAGDKLTIIDACHSGGKSAMADSLTPDSVAEAMSGSSGVKGVGKPVAWLVSCGQNEQSWEDEDSGHGLFTRFLLESLGEAAELVDSNFDGSLSAQEIHEFISHSIGEYILTKKRLRDAKWRGVRQTPQLGYGAARGSDSDELRRLRLFYYDVPFDMQAPERLTSAIAISQDALPETADALFERGLSLYADSDDPVQLREAVDLFEKAASIGNGDAQYYLGMAFLIGKGVGRDVSKAVAFFNKAANQDIASAQNCLGLMYDYGLGVKKDSLLAVDWYTCAVNNNSPQALFSLGWFYHNGFSVSKNEQKAKELYNKASEKEVVIFLHNAAEKGDVWAQNALGLLYATGDRTGILPTNNQKAVFWYRIAAEQGLPMAQSNLAGCYGGGKGVNQNHTEAVKWIRKAVDQEYPFGQLLLGDCYYYGNGVNQDYAEAAEWYRKAADRGISWAQYLLGRCYYTGNGVDQNYSEAVKWFRKAAKQGHSDAQDSLGSF